MNRIMIIQVSFLKLFLKSWDIFDNLLTNIDEIAYLSLCRGNYGHNLKILNVPGQAIIEFEMLLNL